MTVLVTGSSKSGKSRIAEGIITTSERPRFYLATMMPFGEEAEAAIARHRAMRAGKGFVTVEQYTDIGETELPRGCVVLLECMGNLCANEMFSAGEPNPIRKIGEGITALAEKCSLLVVVTNQVGEDGVVYSPETMRYIQCLGNINRALARNFDCVIETVCGIPLVLKGEMPPCLC